MLSIHKTYFYIFCFCVLSLFLAPALLPFSDELCLAAFAALAGLDMLYNRNLRRYRLMFVLLGVMLFYLAYSLAASPYNIPKAQINDFILQCKPLVAFSLSYAIAPKFTAGEKYFLKKLCIVLAIISVITIATGTYKILLAHIYYQGLLCFGCAAVCPAGAASISTFSGSGRPGSGGAGVTRYSSGTSRPSYHLVNVFWLL